MEINSKKEKTILIILAILVGLFVYFMPSIDKFITDKKNNRGVKKNKTEEVKEEKKETKKEEKKETKKEEKAITYNCNVKNIDETTKNEVTKEVIFTINSKDKVEKFILTTTSSFKDIASYNEKKNNNSLKETGVDIVVSSDDKNMVYVEKITKDLTKMSSTTNLEYPNNKKDLEKFVSEEGYTCSYSK